MKTNDNNDLQNKVMDAIKNGRVAMRPRWHFVLRATLVALGATLVFLTLLYLAGLSVFFLHQNGTWFAPAFGPRGWFVLLRSLPWLLISIALLFVAVLEILVRRYSFAYRRPLWFSVIAIVFLVSLGGMVLAMGPFHRRVFPPRGEQPFLGRGLERHFGPPPLSDIHRVEILQMATSSILVKDLLSGVTSTVFIEQRTRLPLGAEFEPGDILVVFGEATSGTIHAFGIQEISE